MSAILLGKDIIHYEVLGRGRPVIFLHSWVGSWRYWIPVMQAATMAYRAYAIDLWGFGDSAKNPERYTIHQQMNLLDGFLEQMGIARMALVGHGLGALVALYYTLTHPEYVDRVMLVGLPIEEGMIHPRLPGATVAELVDWLLVRDPAAEAARTDAPKADLQAIRTSLSGLTGIKSSLMQLTTSCILVNGQNDPAVEAPRVEQIPELPQQMHAVLFEQSGHFPMLDESNKFNRLMADFLALASGESPRQLQLKEEWKRRIR